MNTVPILFTFDDKLILPACVAMSSLLENAFPETFYDIFVIHSDRFDFSETPIGQIPKYYNNCNITFRKVSNEFVGAYEVRGITETCYYRLLSSELIPEYDKILYSDVDVIFRDDLSRYFNLDLEHFYFAAVDNCSRLRPSVRKYLADKLNLDWRDGYFYSGNLVINLSKIRQDGKTLEFRALAKNKYNQQDMDILNIACNKQILNLGPSFCLTNYLYDLIINHRAEMEKIYSSEELEYTLNKGIIHFNGTKPWISWCHHFDIWWEYYRHSPFFNEYEYSSFYDGKRDELDRLSLMKRIKILARYFVFGKK